MMWPTRFRVFVLCVKTLETRQLPKDLTRVSGYPSVHTSGNPREVLPNLQTPTLGRFMMKYMNYSSVNWEPLLAKTEIRIRAVRFIQMAANYFYLNAGIFSRSNILSIVAVADAVSRRGVRGTAGSGSPASRGRTAVPG